MGSYGIGPARDRGRGDRAGRRRARGSCGRARSRPGTCTWSGSARPATTRRAGGRALYGELREAGADVVYDDRDAGPGEKFDRRRAARLPAAARGRQERARRGGDRGAGPPQREAESLPVAEAAKRAARAARWHRLGRLFGLDRSGPRPGQTRRGQPLRPLTIPNLVGYVRLAGIPVFLYLALSSGDGRTAAVGDPLSGDLGGRLPRRLPRPRHRPVQPHGGAAGSGRRPADDPRRRRRLLAVRAAAAMGARGPRRARARRRWCWRSSLFAAASTWRSTGSGGRRYG